MRGVAIVCSCLSLCLWANVVTAEPVLPDSSHLDTLLEAAYEMSSPESEVIWFGRPK